MSLRRRGVLQELICNEHRAAANVLWRAGTDDPFDRIREVGAAATPEHFTVEAATIARTGIK